MIGHKQQEQLLDLQMVCSTKFGRYPEISSEQVWNMYNSDNWMVPYAGYKKILEISDNGYGRGLFISTRGNFMLAIINENVYIVDKYENFIFLASLDTNSGDVFIAENDASQIGICDKQDIYIFNYSSDSFQKAVLNFVPSHLSFQDGYFFAAVADEPKYHKSALNNGLVWGDESENIGVLQAPDNVIAVIPIPNMPNQILVFGTSITHSFSNQGLSPPYFPYARNNSFCIDYGTPNASTIAFGDNFVIWLGNNKKSGLEIMYSEGGTEIPIKSDGINFKLSQVKYPEKSSAFLFKQDGHLFYQLNFYDTNDNFSLIYDFNTKSFYNVSDYNQNFHEAKQTVLFNNKFYFISHNDGNIYELSSDYFTYDGKTIPRIVITPTVRYGNSQKFIGSRLTFPIEQGDQEILDYTEPKIYKGEISSSSDFPSLANVSNGDKYKTIVAVDDNDPTKTNTGQKFGAGDIVWNEDKTKWDVIREISPRIDLSLSRDGGITFGSYVSTILNKEGHRKNIYSKNSLGRANELTMQFRFYGKCKFVFTNGKIKVKA